MMKYLITLSILLSNLLLANPVNAALFDRGNGMIYDNVNAITWLADANYFKTQLAANTNLVSAIMTANAGGINDSSNTLNPTGVYTLTAADFDEVTGSMTWWGAQAWVNTLTVGGVSGWTLPVTEPPVSDFDQTTTQFGHLYYNDFGGLAVDGVDPLAPNPNYALFTNIQDYYWTSTEADDPNNALDPNNAPDPSYAWMFGIINGSQDIDSKNPTTPVNAWAIHIGDVAAVPVPSAVWLFLTGLSVLFRVKQKRNS